MAEDTFINQVWAAVRLEEVSAANFLYNTESHPEANLAGVDPALQKTIGCIEAIFKLADRLGQVKYVGARLNAERIRKEAGKILEAVVHDPRCNKETLARLQTIIHEELAHWQSDSEMWIGDRALGLYVYEVVRDGLILRILTEEEEGFFRQEGTLKYLTSTTQETADEDQIYYLKTMRNVINKCRREFHQRPLLGSKIIDDLESQENRPSYPIVAAKLLLSEIDNALLLQMVDLARTRAWAVALSIALGKEPSNNINPVNGKPYYITENDKEVLVRILPKDEKVDLKSPLDEEARQFIANQIDRTVVVPKPMR